MAWQLRKPIVALTPHGGWAQELAGRALDHRRDEVVLAAVDVDAAIRHIHGNLKHGGSAGAGF